MTDVCERKAEAYFFTQRAKAFFASSLIYMSPLSSTHPASDTGCVYFINPVDRSFKIVNAASGEALESFKDVEWKYKAFTEEEWANWFELDIGVPNIRSYANKCALVLSRLSPARYGWESMADANGRQIRF